MIINHNFSTKYPIKRLPIMLIHVLTQSSGHMKLDKLKAGKVLRGPIFPKPVQGIVVPAMGDAVIGNRP
jgi:hypothetical protein